MKLIKWEISLGLFNGLLIGYRQYIDDELLKVDHVIYLGLFDCCLTLFYRDNGII